MHKHASNVVPSDTTDPRARDLAAAAAAVDELFEAALEFELRNVPSLAGLSGDALLSARNLLHYLGIRHRDIRPVQERLHRLGLSALGNMEPHVLATLAAVRGWLALALGNAPDAVGDAVPMSAEQADALFARRVEQGLGAAPRDRSTRIMVTLPDEASDDEAVSSDLWAAGMDVARINCAHGDAEHWRRAAANLRAASKRVGHAGRICFDLPGPKLRVGPIEPGPGVFKWKPQRDAFGRTTAPAIVVLLDEGVAEDGDEAALPLAGRLAGKARAGDRIELDDARGRHRVMEVVDVYAGRCICHCERTGYVIDGTRLTLRRGRKKLAHASVAGIAAAPGTIAIAPGDRLELLAGGSGRVEQRDDDGQPIAPARIACLVPEVVGLLRVGHRVLLDDGKAIARVTAVSPQSASLRIEHVHGGHMTLREDRGINVPDTALSLPPLGPSDEAALAALARQADMVAMSFVQSPSDVGSLLEALAHHDAQRLTVVLKIETRRAFENLPSILLAALRHHQVAVMVARGDLGVEVGFERLAEVQEEILWICEAAHVPVIWATQVLETLAREGQPSRPEVSDASLGVRSECVMLNKGPFQLDALRFLSAVLCRMQDHLVKKRALMRRLHLSLRGPEPGG